MTKRRVVTLLDHSRGIAITMRMRRKISPEQRGSLDMCFGHVKPHQPGKADNAAEAGV